MLKLTHHAKKRMRQRSVGPSRVRHAAYGRRTSLGGGRYRAEYQGPGGATVVVVYKREGGKKVILSTWKVFR